MISANSDSELRDWPRWAAEGGGTPMFVSTVAERQPFWRVCPTTFCYGRLDAQYGGGISYLMNHHPGADPRRSRSLLSSISKFVPIASFVTSWTSQRSPFSKNGCRKSASFFALP